MTSVPILLLKGLAEGLVLATVEREPTDGQGLLDRIEQLLGQAPNQNQVFPLLERMEREGLLEGEGADDPTQRTFDITPSGTDRRNAYQVLPEALGPALVQLLGLDAAPALDGRPEAVTDPTTQTKPTPPSPAVEPDPSLPPEAWVDPLLELVPPGARVRAPFARVRLDRQPAQHSWVLRVEQHEPGSYDGACACALTFLYEAATRLLFQAARAPDTTAEGQAPSAVPGQA